MTEHTIQSLNYDRPHTPKSVDLFSLMKYTYWWIKRSFKCFTIKSKEDKRETPTQSETQLALTKSHTKPKKEYEEKEEREISHHGSKSISFQFTNRF